MVRKELLAMRPLNATAKMVEIERADIPEKVPGTYWDPPREYSLFARCRVENDILKVALFYPDSLHTGGRKPSYEVFIDHTARKYITYDRIFDKWRTAKVDRLDWPRYISAKCGTWMSAADKKTVQAYLGGRHDGYDGVLEYQERLQEEALVRRHKKETDPWDADLSLIPKVPKDWDRWVNKVGIPQNYIFYQYKKRGAKQGYCTYCEKDVPITGRPRHNKTGRCPRCRHEITFKSVGKMSQRLHTGLNCAYLLQPRPDGFIVREFWVGRIYDKDDWRTPEVSCSEHRRFLYDAQMNPRRYYWGNYKNREFRWIAGMPNSSWYSFESNYYYHGDKPGRVYGKTLLHLCKTQLARTGLLEFLHGTGFTANPDDYFSVLNEVPQLEQLAKAGLPKLAVECIYSSSLLRRLFKDDHKHGLTKSLGIDTPRLARLRRCNGGENFLTWLLWEKAQDKILDDGIIQSFCQWELAPSDLSFILDRMSPVQVCNYLRRQISSSGEECRQVLTTWKDYLFMAEKLKMDTSDAIIYRARLLRQRHDELVVRCAQKDNKRAAAAVRKKFPGVDKVCQSIKKKYEYADEEFAVVAPNGALDIIVEGQLLHHCVGSIDRYWDRIQRHETYILFLRKVSNLDAPFYTLEIEPNGTVRQKRTMFDRQDKSYKVAVKFLEKWQKVVAKRLTADDQEKAAVSRVLREQEFEQMRKDNVIIHMGDLAGQRLVDVLTADVMENAA